MRWALLLLLLVPQDDPFKTLTDPARRAGESARRAALDSFRAGAKDGVESFVAARFLEKSDRQWHLVNDKDVRDPAAGDIDAYLQKYWSSAPAADKHAEALAALGQAAEKWPKTEALEVLRLFASAHLASLGDKGAAVAGKLGFTKEGGRWALRDQATLHAIAKDFAKPSYIPADVERAVARIRDLASASPQLTLPICSIRKG